MEEHPSSATHPQRREEDPFPWNVVVMGMGEPLLNYDATVAALRVRRSEEGFAIPAPRPPPRAVDHPAALARSDGVRRCCRHAARARGSSPAAIAAAGRVSHATVSRILQASSKREYKPGSKHE